MRALVSVAARRASLRVSGHAETLLKRGAVARLNEAIALAKAAEASSDLLRDRIDARLHRILDAAKTTQHYSPVMPKVVSDPHALWADLPVLRREQVRSRPTAFLTPNSESCFVRTTTGSSGELGYVVKPRSSLTERGAIERRWFDCLNLPTFFDLTMVTAWRDLRPFLVRFNDWRIRYRAVSFDQARQAMLKGERIGDVVVCTPRIATSLRRIGARVAQRYASSFEFSQPARALFGIGDSDTPECTTEAYVAGELSAPVPFRFPNCAFLHVNSDAILVQIVDPGTRQSIEDGLAGRIVVTDLLNTAMPLIRYELGDFGAIVGREPCSCGRVTPRLRLIAREADRCDPLAHHLGREVLARSEPMLLVKVAPDKYLLYTETESHLGRALPDGVIQEVETRMVSEMPTLLMPLLTSQTPLSIAERPMPT